MCVCVLIIGRSCQQDLSKWRKDQKMLGDIFKEEKLSFFVFVVNFSLQNKLI